MNAEERHALAVQRQALEQQRGETTLALKELATATRAYRFVGGLLIETDATKLREELTTKQGSIEARLQSIARLEKDASTKQ